MKKDDIKKELILKKEELENTRDNLEKLICSFTIIWYNKEYACNNMNELESFLNEQDFVKKGELPQDFVWGLSESELNEKFEKHLKNVFSLKEQIKDLKENKPNEWLWYNDLSLMKEDIENIYEEINNRNHPENMNDYFQDIIDNLVEIKDSYEIICNEYGSLEEILNDLNEAIETFEQAINIIC